MFMSFVSTQRLLVFHYEAHGGAQIIPNSCHSASCKEFYYFVYFIKKKRCSFKELVLLVGSFLAQLLGRGAARLRRAGLPGGRGVLGLRSCRDGLAGGARVALSAAGVRVSVHKERCRQNSTLQVFVKVSSVCLSSLWPLRAVELCLSPAW